MKNKNSLPRKTERGQSLVELAISMTIILLLLSGLVTFGMAFFSYVSISDAAQEGALYASVNGDPSGTFPNSTITIICQQARNTSSTPVDFSSFTCNGSGSGNNIQVSGSACENGSNGASANAVTVTVTYNYTVFMPFMSGIIGSNTIPLKASATDTMLQPVCP